MNASFRLLFAPALAVTLATAGHARIDRTVEKTYTVTGAGTLHLETQGGEIRVTPATDNQVKITVREKIHADTDAEADQLLKKLELNFEQSGNDVTAIAKYERDTGFHIGWWPPVTVDLIVTAPAGYATETRTSGGGITIGDFNGKAYAHTSGGGIKLGKIGAEVEAKTSGGSIALDEARGDVDLNTSGGNISVGRISGSANIATSGGSIKITAVQNSIRAHTSGGSITAGVVGPLKADSSLSTSGGSVHVTVDKSAAFRLDAATSGGSVDASGLTLTLESSGRDRNRLAGMVNGGGPELKLRTSGGGIVVRPD